MRLQPDASNFTDIYRDAGEMGQRMRELDWARTPLGAPTTWPQSLKTAVQIMLGSRYAMWMGWGPELTFFYNDAYRPTLGTKHPWALGKPSQLVWTEIWRDIGPRIEEVLRTGRATYDEDLMLILERSGYPEETFHTFSYSPLRDDLGNVGGHLCVVIEDTVRVISDRRLRVMRDIGARITKTRSVDSLFNEICECLATNERDLPFTLFYLLRPDGENAELVCSTGIHSNHPAAAPEIGIHSGQSPWPIAEALSRATPLLIEINAARLDQLPTGAWERRGRGHKHPRQGPCCCEIWAMLS
jgi:hypothetical protein